MKKKPIWIAVTGIDGVGKTTICNYVLKLLKRKGKKAEFMKIPYFDWVRDMLKISGHNSPDKDCYTDALIFATAHRIEDYVIKDFLKNTDFLVTQRCWLDNIPYRKVQGFSQKEIFQLLKPERFAKPNIIFFLRGNYATAYNRIKNSNGDKYEQKKLMKLHEQEFKKIFIKIKKNKFQIRFPNTKIINLDSNVSLEKLKLSVETQLNKLKIL